MVLIGLPSRLAIRSKATGKYLRLDEDGLLKFSGEKLFDARLRFEVETADTGAAKEGLFHLRSCYNNKYCRRASESNQWITAAAADTEEDKSKWSCTLFKADAAEEEKDDPTSPPRFRITHVQLHRSLSSYPENENCYAGGGGGGGGEADIEIHHDNSVGGRKEQSTSPPSSLEGLDLLTHIDWDTLFLLPKHVALKADNGLYLRPLMLGSVDMNFQAADPFDVTAAFTTFESSGGSFHIRSDYLHMNFRDAWWGLTGMTNLVSAVRFGRHVLLFEPIPLQGNVVALKLSTRHICHRVSIGSRNAYAIDARTVTREARVELTEPVLNRSIYNVHYRTADARLYDRKILVKASGQAVNTTEEPSSVEMVFSYQEVRTSTWNGYVSASVGVSTSFRAGIPFIARGRVEISTEISGGYEWGETKQETSEVETKYKVTVPPKSKLRVVLMATDGYCDVPFTYTRRDLLCTGAHVITTLEEGVYTGVSTYDFRYEAHELPLDPDDLLFA